jgi:hypothetical protein
MRAIFATRTFTFLSSSTWILILFTCKQRQESFFTSMYLKEIVKTRVVDTDLLPTRIQHFTSIRIRIYNVIETGSNTIFIFLFLKKCKQLNIFFFKTTTHYSWPTLSDQCYMNDITGTTRNFSPFMCSLLYQLPLLKPWRHAFHILQLSHFLTLLMEHMYMVMWSNTLVGPSTIIYWAKKSLFSSPSYFLWRLFFNNAN